ncbi:hypothetical protein OJ998_01165 [Solirubrobacter taibaiensis]|nr:hypothetical protein [Solirubrobacter taibaiensis]
MREPFFGWAADAVDGLEWLVELDDWAFANEREQLRGRHPKLVDVVHVRWAVSTAITAIDLCAAEVARRFGGLSPWTDRVPVLAGVIRDVERGRYVVSEEAASWLDAVAADTAYRTIKAARDPLTHRFLVRSAMIWNVPPQGHHSRTEFAVPVESGQGRPDARTLILLAHDVADRYVMSFAHVLQAL